MMPHNVKKSKKNRSSSTNAITDTSKNRGSKIYKSNKETTYEEEEVEYVHATEKNEKRTCFEYFV